LDAARPCPSTTYFEKIGLTRRCSELPTSLRTRGRPELSSIRALSYQLEQNGHGTCLIFRHSGFDMSQPWSEQAFRGADFGWQKMLERLSAVVAGLRA
jgi:hypothetical protein